MLVHSVTSQHGRRVETSPPTIAQGSEGTAAFIHQYLRVGCGLGAVRVVGDTALDKTDLKSVFMEPRIWKNEDLLHTVNTGFAHIDESSEGSVWCHSLKLPSQLAAPAGLNAGKPGSRTHRTRMSLDCLTPVTIYYFKSTTDSALCTLVKSPTVVENSLN